MLAVWLLRYIWYVFDISLPLIQLFGCDLWVQYVAIDLASQMGLSPLAEASMAALLGRYLWASLDVVGLKYMWWTWHSSEPLYSDRHNGVPVASTFWATATIGSLSWMFALLEASGTFKHLSQGKHISQGRKASTCSALPSCALLGAVLGPVASGGVMNLPFTVIYHPMVTFAGLEAQVAMNVFEVACFACVMLSLAIPRDGNSMRAGKQLCFTARASVPPCLVSTSTYRLTSASLSSIGQALSARTGVGQQPILPYRWQPWSP
jgi:hypothetical protein